MLKHSSTQVVKFSEADPLGIVWHGHFIRYFEDGRESFGEKYGISYLDFYRNNIVVPIVDVRCEYKRILRYGHKIVLETTYHDTVAAKLQFTYRILDAATQELVATGSSTQVFLHRDSLQLMLSLPDFMIAWKEKWLKQ